jgi:hypothetical protein
VGDRQNPDSIRLLQVNDAERKSFRLPTPRAEFSGMSVCGIVLDFRQGFVNGVQKRFSEKFAAVLVEGRRLGRSLSASR